MLQSNSISVAVPLDSQASRFSSSDTQRPRSTFRENLLPEEEERRQLGCRLAASDTHPPTHQPTHRQKRQKNHLLANSIHPSRSFVSMATTSGASLARRSDMAVFSWLQSSLSATS